MLEKEELEKDMWHRSILECVDKGKKRGLCLYGAGYWGEVAFKVFQKLGITPTCYCDDNPEKWNQKKNDLPIYSLEQGVERYPEAVYIVCIDETKKKGSWDREKQKHMVERLKSLGVYDRNTELRILYYVFLLDISSLDQVGEAREIEDNIKEEDIQNIILFNNMSNSGSYYLEQLLDGHRNILCLPYSETLENVYVNRMQYLEGDELLIEMMAQMLGYLHSEFEQLYCVGQHRFQGYCVNQEGHFIKDIYIDPTIFIQQLKLQLGDNRKLKSYAHMLKVYFAAYNNCLGKKKEKNTEYWIFYHMHLPNYDPSTMYAHLNADEFKRVENLIIIREPVQHCYSWIRRFVMKEKNNAAVKKEAFSHIINSELGIMLEKKKGFENVKAIKFEDLKSKPEETLKSLCRWIDIPYMDSLKSTTVNGIEIYFPALTPDGMKYITGNDQTPVACVRFTEAMTLWDETRLNMIFSSFKKAYGYENSIPEFLEFSREQLKDILKRDFKFATLVEELICEKGAEDERYNVNEWIKKLFMEYIESHQKEKEYYPCILPED